MTTVTKIFVVLVCLFAFVFTPMVIQFAARTHDWKTLAGNLADDAETAIAHEGSTLAIAASTVEHLKARLERQTDLTGKAQLRIRELEEEKTKLTGQIQTLEGSKGSWENAASALSAELQVINTHNQELIKENNRLAQSELDLNSQNIRLQDRIEELTAKTIIFAQQLKQRVEELAHAREENRSLREAQGPGLAATGEFPGTATPSAAPAPKQIRGTVIQTHDAQGLVSIDVGGASGIVKDMTMVVIRGGEYICDLIITDVSDTEAVGRVDSGAQKKVRADDMVIDAGSFMAGAVD